MDPLIKAQGGKMTPAEAQGWMVAEGAALDELLAAASELRRQGKGQRVTYSRKVFIPLTTYCRDDCGYCTFKRDPGQPGARYLRPEEVMAIAAQGVKTGCKEALFSLGDKPEARFPEARAALHALGMERTTGYLEMMTARVRRETGLLPHPNAGVMSRREMAALREHSPSMGLMLENVSPRFSQPGMPHAGAPDKVPAARLANLRYAGELRIPFTTGLLIGIGETPAERVDALLAIQSLHARHGHIQEVILQNFRAKPGIPMADHPDASLEDLLRTIAVARLLLGPGMNLQAPPNLNPGGITALLRAGINDWGGISPVTPDHINPEAPWPHLADLAARCAEAGFTLRERLTIYPEYIHDRPGFMDKALEGHVKSLADGEGYARHPAHAA